MLFNFMLGFGKFHRYAVAASVGLALSIGLGISLGVPQAIVARSQTRLAQKDFFREGIYKANRAYVLSQSARNAADWNEVAKLWIQAVAAMQNVPMRSSKRALAEKKVVEYMRNFAYAQERAAISSNLSYPTFNSDILDQQLELYLSYIESLGVPDIMIVGSSRALQGLDPSALQTALAARGKGNLKIFNFGINGATAKVVEFQLKKLLSVEQLPRQIIFADGVRAFNSGRSDRTYNEIIRSPGYQRLASGIRPSLTSAALEGNFAREDSQENSQENPLATSLENTSAKENSYKWSKVVAEDPPQPPPLRLRSGHAFARGGKKADGVFKGGLGGSSDWGIPFVSTGFDHTHKQSLEDGKESRWLGAAAELPLTEAIADLWIDRIDANGFKPVSEQFNPATYYRRHRRVAGRYDRDYESFWLGGEQDAAFKAVVAFVQSRKIPLLVVGLPLTWDYLDWDRSVREQQFRQYMQRLARNLGFAWRDLSQGNLSRNDYFQDPSHINRYGAAAVARQLAADPRLTWPRAR